jgi:hypothetical protein
VKLGVVTLSIVPEVPPCDGADRAWDAPESMVAEDPPVSDVAEKSPASTVVEASPMSAVVAGDEAQPAENPITADISTAARVYPLFRFDRHRRVDAATGPPEIPASGGAAVAPKIQRSVRFSRGAVRSQSFMAVFLFLLCGCVESVGCYVMAHVRRTV